MKKLWAIAAMLLLVTSLNAQNAAENDLIRSSIVGDMEGAMSALGSGAKIECRDGNGRTPLLLACKMGHTPLVIVYLDRGASMASMDEEGANPLMMAAKGGHPEVVQVLLTKAPKLEAVDKNGMTALMLAAENGHTEVMGMLLEAGAKPVFTKQEDLEVAKTGSQQDNLNAKLLNAIQNHEAEVALEMIAAGAKPDARSKRNIPALIMAAARKQAAVVAALLDKGADADIRATDAEKGIEQITALHVASTNGHIEILQLLLERGAEVNAQDKSGLTPLMAASELGNTVAVILLIDKGADVNLQDYDGLSPLMLSAYTSQHDVARILLDHEAKPDLADDTFVTALMISAQQGDVEMVKLLLEKGANPKVRMGPNGYRAVDLAKVNGHKEVVALLKE
ncbi:MAG: ankyrin repeat domain-containing protein [Bacteroidia bacterium]